MYVIQQAGPGSAYPSPTGSVRTVRDGVVGTLTNASFSGLAGVAVSPSGLLLYISERPANTITAVDTASGQYTRLTGQASDVQGWRDGDRDSAMFSHPAGLAISPDGATLYVADIYNHAIRVVRTATGNTATLCGHSQTAVALLGIGGDDGPVGVGRLNTPVDVALSRTTAALLFVADYGTQCDYGTHLGAGTCARVRMVDTATGHLSTLAGSGTQGYANGIGVAASFMKIHAVALSMDGATLYVGSQYGGNDMVRAIDLQSRAVTTLVHNTSALGGVNGLCLSSHYDGALFAAWSANNQVIRIT